MHAAPGGIVPEVAARAHLRWIVPVLDEAWADAGVAWSDRRAIAVTYGPGLAGSLLVGVNFAKALAWVHDLPLIGVNHLEGHVYAAWLLDPGEADREEPVFPLVALVVSGGHTFLVEMRDHLTYRLLGTTVDDAAGEAFDKVGRLLGLGYPGGPAIGRAAEARDRRRPASRGRGCGGTYDFSFSGLKTAARRIVDEARADAGLRRRAGRAAARRTSSRSSRGASRTRSSDVLATKTIRAAGEVGARSIVLGGGVAANSALRARLAGEAEALGVPLIVPRPALCTDNGAMIGAAGARRFDGRRPRRDGPRRPSVAAPGRSHDGRGRTAAARCGRRPRDAPRRPACAPGIGCRRTSSPISTCSRGSSPRRPRRPAGGILEIGPGLGLLTGALLDAGAAVTAVELDRGLAAFLRDQFESPRVWPRSTGRHAGLVRLIEGDALDQDLVHLVEPPYDVVANLPYHITSPILHALLGSRRAPNGAC